MRSILYVPEFVISDKNGKSDKLYDFSWTASKEMQVWENIMNYARAEQKQERPQWNPKISDLACAADSLCGLDSFTLISCPSLSLGMGMGFLMAKSLVLKWREKNCSALLRNN